LKGEFYNDWARPNGLHSGLFAVLMRDSAVNGSVCLTAGSLDRDFDAEDLKFLSMLVPHLQRATQADTCIADAIRGAGAAAALSGLRQGVLLVAADGAVLYANPAAETITAEADGVSIEQGKLCAITPALTAALRQAVAASAAVPTDPLVAATMAYPDRVLRLERPSGRQPLAVLIVPLPHRTMEVWATALPVARAIVFLTDLERETRPPLDILRRLYGLTAREAMLAIQISRGEGLQAVADHLGIARATAHTHLLRVFAKTDTRRQAELVRLVERLRSVSQK
jgi:DNA-binding CsgD family transcriptional regulator